MIGYLTLINGLSINDLLSECTRAAKELKLTSDYAIKEEDAKTMISKLGKIKGISEISDKTERDRQYDKYPDLKVLKTEITHLVETFKLPPEERKKMLKSNEGMQKSIMKLSLLDPNNELSPLRGRNIKKYANKGGKKIKSGGKRGELKVKLIFKKLIPPSSFNKNK